MTTITRHKNKTGELTDALVIRDARTSFMNVFRPKKNDLNDKMEYAVDLMIPKDTDMSVIEDLISELSDRKWGRKVPAFRYECIKDGNAKDLEKYPEYADMWYIVAKNETKPNVIDEYRNTIDETEANLFQSGLYCNAFVRLFAYSKGGNHGISVSLDTIQRIPKGAPLSGGVLAKPEIERVFDSAPVDMDI